ncbi:MAG TPA: vitamin K epoxide reductase family protein [Solirubrobacteraceae bacterium]|nr:vitamin K epoxide reductase family protein [Solirubrobacteraceae bacterium]
MTEARLRACAIVLAVLGIGVAGYLTYVHYADLDPVCVGGGGGCAIVQASDQSKLAGIPVALLGLLAYLTLLACGLLRTETARMVAALTALVGFGFSVYLTYESVTVIEHTCQWCLMSLTLMTLSAVVCTARLLRA